MGKQEKAKGGEGGGKKEAKKLKEMEKKLQHKSEELDKAHAQISELKTELEAAKKGAAKIDQLEELQKEKDLTEKKLKRVQKEAKEVKKLREQLTALEEEVEESGQIIMQQSQKIKELPA